MDLGKLVSADAAIRIDSRSLHLYQEVCGLAVEDVVPTTYPFTLATRGLCDRGAFDGLLHIRSRIEHYRTLMVNDLLLIHNEVGVKRESRLGLSVDLKSTIERGGEVVWRQKSTLLSPNLKTGEDGGGRSLQNQSTVTTQVRSAEPINGETTSDGEVLATYETALRYASISGDWNPLHTGVPGENSFDKSNVRIAHGMWVAARMSRHMRLADTKEQVALAVSFHTPIVLPTMLKFRLARDLRSSTAVAVHGSFVKACVSATLRPLTV